MSGCFYLGAKQNPNIMTDMNAPKGVRPTFLTVLCILSFIAGGWGVIGGIIGLASQPDTDELKAQMEQAMGGLDELGDDNPMAGLAQSMAEQAVQAAEAARPMNMANIGLALLSLIGVWQMWNLKKSGFYLYVLASLGGLAVPLIFLGGGLLALMSVGIGGFIALVFIILYALNLKHMH